MARTYYGNKTCVAESGGAAIVFKGVYGDRWGLPIIAQVHRWHRVLLRRTMLRRLPLRSLRACHLFLSLAGQVRHDPDQPLQDHQLPAMMHFVLFRR